MEVLHRLRHFLVGVAVAAIVFSALPVAGFEVPSAALSWIGNVTGLEQRWQMFAPNVRSEARWLEVREERTDGTLEVWRLEDRRSLSGGYRGYHWRKLGDFSARPDGRRRCRLIETVAETLLRDRPGVRAIELTALSSVRTEDIEELILTRRVLHQASRIEWGILHEREAPCG